MASLLGIFVFKECRPVEADEAGRTVGKMSGHPIENDRQVFSVACVDQRRKIGRRAETTGRREQAGGLITPGAIKGMLADRQKFHVRKSHLMRVSLQLLCQLAVAQPPAALLRM